MAWFRNHYSCSCGSDHDTVSWDMEWSCTCNDECPECGTFDIEPHSSDDLTVVIEPLRVVALAPAGSTARFESCLEPDADAWAVHVSPPTAEDDPEYLTRHFTSRVEAEVAAAAASHHILEPA